MPATSRGRPKILVYNWCYHGTVDETIITINDGVPGPKPGNIGPPVDPALTTKVVEFNDVAALEAALAPGDVACVLAEPALTNIGIVLPEPGYHDALRQITRETGTLLVIDETHTICAGPGGYTQAWGLEPDMLTIGKPIGSGMPAAAYGFGQAWPTSSTPTGTTTPPTRAASAARWPATRSPGGHARHAGEVLTERGLRPHHPAGRSAWPRASRA